MTEPGPVFLRRWLHLDGVRLDILCSPMRLAVSRLLDRSVTGGSRRQRGGADGLQDINCTIHEGDRVALIGHNGAGKSTFCA